MSSCDYKEEEEKDEKMNNFNHMESLRNKEFLILEKLSNDSVSDSEKQILKEELRHVRSEIAKLR